MKKKLVLLITLFSLFSYIVKAQLPGGSELFIDASSTEGQLWFSNDKHVFLDIIGSGGFKDVISVTELAEGETDIYEVTLPLHGLDSIISFMMYSETSVTYSTNPSDIVYKSLPISPEGTNNMLTIDATKNMRGTWSIHYYDEITTAAKLLTDTPNSLIDTQTVTVTDAITTDHLTALENALGINTAITNITFNGSIPTYWERDYFSACTANPIVTVNAPITLTDGVNVNLPRKVTIGSANTISYTRDAYRDHGWETIILPFAVTTANLSTDFTFEGYTTIENDVVKFETVTALEANTPYIMKWEGPFNNTKIEIEFIGTEDLQTTAALSGENLKEIWESVDIEPVVNNPYYILNSTGTCFVRVANKTVTLKPYHFYYYTDSPTYAPAQFSVIHEKGNNTTNISTNKFTSKRIYGGANSIYIESATAENISIYTVQGLLIRKAKIEKGVNRIEYFARGLYIIANQKVIVK